MLREIEGSSSERSLKPHVKISGSAVHKIKKELRCFGLHTVCEEAKCPNMHECFGRGTATFMILGDVCTRSCKFCSVKNLKHWNAETLKRPYSSEPLKIAQMAKELRLKHVVITSVTRDDLPDEGSEQFARTIEAIRRHSGESRNLVYNGGYPPSIEILTPDFHARKDCLKTVCKACPDIFNHNIETVRRLTPIVRSHADYDRSLQVLSWVKKNYPLIKVKSGIMAGLGEKEEEIVETLRDLCNVGCEVVTIGQYLRPSKNCLPVKEYVSQRQFEKYKVIGEELGIKHIFSGAKVRSSYMAEKNMEGLWTEI